jgi:threonine synthase
VPTGNFGNVLAAWAAKQMGLPIERLIVGSNSNDILARFLASNDMRMAGVVETVSPSMDIQVSSNFERLLFEFLHRDATATARIMADFRATGRMAVPEPVWQAVRREFAGFALDDAATLAEIARIKQDYGYIADPHSAIGIAAARACAPVGLPVIAAATAHPAKFPDAMERAIGTRPGLPSRLAHLYDKREQFHRAPAALADIETMIRRFANRNSV